MHCSCFLAALVHFLFPCLDVPAILSPSKQKTPCAGAWRDRPAGLGRILSHGEGRALLLMLSPPESRFVRALPGGSRRYFFWMLLTMWIGFRCLEQS